MLRLPFRDRWLPLVLLAVLARPAAAQPVAEAAPAEVDDQAADFGAIDLTAAASPLEGWLQRAMRFAASVPNSEVATSNVQQGRLATLLYRIDLNQPLLASVHFPLIKLGEEDWISQRLDTVLLWSTTDPQSFDDRRLVQGDPAAMFQPRRGELQPGDIGYAAADGSHILVAADSAIANREGLQKWVDELAKFELAGDAAEQPKADTAGQPKADTAGQSTLSLRLDLTGVSDTIREVFVQSFLEGATSELDSAEEIVDPAERAGADLGIEAMLVVVRKMDRLAAVDADLVIDDALGTSLELATHLQPLPAGSDPPPGRPRYDDNGRCSDYLNKPAFLFTTDCRLSDEGRALFDPLLEMFTEATEDLLGDDVSSTESRFMRVLSEATVATVRAGQLDFTYAYAAAGDDADDGPVGSIVMGLEVVDAEPTTEAIDAFLTEQPQLESDDPTFGIRWMAVPAPQRAQGTVWVGIDGKRVWLVVGDLAPAGILQRPKWETPAQPARTELWAAMEVDMDQVAANRDRISALVGDPNLVDWDALPTGRANWVLRPTEDGLMTRLRLSGETVRGLAGSLPATGNGR